MKSPYTLLSRQVKEAARAHHLLPDSPGRTSPEELSLQKATAGGCWPGAATGRVEEAPLTGEGVSLWGKENVLQTEVAAHHGEGTDCHGPTRFQKVNFRLCDFTSTKANKQSPFWSYSHCTLKRQIIPKLYFLS